MNQVLTILEVSRKQEYIFSSRDLKGNAVRSDEIRQATSCEFFQSAAGELFQEENLVYSGGGHAVLQFSTREQAKAFVQKVTWEAVNRYEGMELFATHIPYNPEQTAGENMETLVAKLEEKKALRKAAFRYTGFGLEGALPERDYDHVPEPIQPPAGRKFPRKFSELNAALPEDKRKGSFIAVVHIDGNAMGKRVRALHKQNEWDFAQYRQQMQQFSTGIQQDFERAFSAMTEELIESIDGLGETLPLRPIILAGDDVCFVSAGSVALECARLFLEHLGKQVNVVDQKSYAACAGVALVHEKYPFAQAYACSEELCSNAKRFGAKCNKNGENSTLCVMDWHIEFGQMKDSLDQLREDYWTEDGNRLELRPVIVSATETQGGDFTRDLCTYDFFRNMCRQMQKNSGKVARSKWKELRTALKQGEVESQFYLHDRQIGDILYDSFLARYHTADQRMEQYAQYIQTEKQELDKMIFCQIGEEKRCLYFDALELMDHCVFLGGNKDE